MMGNNLFRRSSLTIVWIWLGLFALLPNAALLLVTLLDKGDTDFFIPVLTLSNYSRLLDPVFINIFLDSLWLAGLSTLICLILGYPFAYAVTRVSPRLRPWLLLLIIIPFWTNSLIRTYALIIILTAQGLLSKIVMALGLSETPMSFMYTDTTVLIGLTYTLLPFMILPLYASIEKLDRALLDAAKDLGASSLRTFWHISLPLTAPGIVAGCILVFLPSLGMFYIPEILKGSTSMLLGTFIKNQFLISRDWPLGAAASTILTLLLFLLVVGYRVANKFAGQRENNDTSTTTLGANT